MGLSDYNNKRNFSKTSEPKGIKRKTHNKKLKYVIQHHIARKDHYDLRLEWDGVFVSFAVPKGPSSNVKDKRLAVKVEDHPLSYGNFEGNIPNGEYGAGSVMLWDKGTWKPNGNVNFNSGVVKFEINGKRVKGKYFLIKFKGNNWLLIKEKDEYANTFSVDDYKKSIKTDRTMHEIANNFRLSLDDIEITSSDKVVIEKGNITKGEIVEYYKLVSEKMMPFLDNRLISTVRSPNNDKFFMKHLNKDVNRDLGKKIITDKDGNKSDYYYIKNTSGIIKEVQMNSYEFHVWGCKQNSISHPDIIVFDFDPDEKLSLKSIRQGVLDLKSILDEYKLKSYLKTSGSKGYHVVVSYKSTSWAKTEKIAKSIAELMVLKWPDKYTTNMRKINRKNKIFIDYFRNKKGATSVCPYSIRLKDNASISASISWKELNTIKPNEITIKNIKSRLKKKDPWNGFSYS